MKKHIEGKRHKNYVLAVKLENELENELENKLKNKI
jgi:hypothetical protein